MSIRRKLTYVKIAVVIVALGASLLSHQTRHPAALSSPYRDLSPADSTNPLRPIAVIGDTQRTLWVERLMGRETNDRERPVLIEGMQNDHPGFIIHLGDMVNEGSSQTEWNYFDALMAGIREQNLPVLPCLGNHDYWHYFQSERQRQRLLFENFPILDHDTWYMRTYGPLALIFLDSNRDEMSAQQWAQQQAWLHDQMQGLDKNTAIRGILAFEHHPPYTNSEVTGDEHYIQDDIVPILSQAPKFMAMITGHAHAYEHFLMNGKNFIVSGGGGGPRVSLHSGDSQRHPDLFSGPSPRPLHYLLLSLTSNGVHLEAKGFQKGPDEQVRTFDQFDLPFSE